MEHYHAEKRGKFYIFINKLYFVASSALKSVSVRSFTPKDPIKAEYIQQQPEK